MFEWNENYSVGVHNIDAQHKSLFAIAAELHAAMAAGKSKPLLGKTLERLVQYTEAHFAYEERLMLGCKYPGFAAHKVEHTELTRKVKQCQQEFESGRIALGVDLLHFLKTWLQTHIRQSDKKYVPYFEPAA